MPVCCWAIVRAGYAHHSGGSQLTDTVAKRGRGRPKGTDFESLSEYDKVEHVEAQLDRMVDRRYEAEQVARSSEDEGYESAYQIIVAEYYRKAREERRVEWFEYFMRLAANHEKLRD